MADPITMSPQSAHDAAEHARESQEGVQPRPTDSMVTVPLSETDGTHAIDHDDDDASTPIPQMDEVEDEAHMSARPNSAAIREAFGRAPQGDESTTRSPTISLSDADSPRTPISARRSRRGSQGSSRSSQVDWAELEKKEEQEPQEAGQDEAMALLLARLEQENNALMADAKAGTQISRDRSQSRPPSIHQLRRLVQEDASLVRYSQLPSPPPMTELEFWAALVRDYPQTVQRLPTLTLNKIRGGIPAPLRGVVWQSASGARDKLIEDQYDTLCGESSPYENIINKDLGRSFPGVDMFKDPDGEGQKMLGRVLKCFSLYDHKIGYCQGLGFLVGPLLMQMGDKEAFCVLVRLMEDYDLRSCFLPDLSGLHLRIFQFQRLLHQHMPELARHLDDLHVESAYLSQWFLSFFAVTCPLPMLFRVYDVLFAEGASETIMRVALALMKRNEQKILALTEFEDVMQLLLGRSLWDPYGRNASSADDLVSDFVGFTNDVTREKLQGLEVSFKAEQGKCESKAKVQNTATSFLGRLWGPSNSSTKSVTLSPGLTAPSRPGSFLRRTPSKQSLASTLHSVDGSETSAVTQSTALTDLSRGSSGDALSLKSTRESTALSVRTGQSSKDRDLHYQIEQLLTSVGQLQRQNSELEAALQKQREDRREDQRLVRTVVDRFRRRQAYSTLSSSTRESRRRTTVTAATVSDTPSQNASPAESVVSWDLEEAADALDRQFPVSPSHNRQSSIFETRQSLRDDLARSKERLASETSRAQALARDLHDAQTDLHSSRDALRETRQRLQDSYNTNQKLERALIDVRSSSKGIKMSLPWGLATDANTPDPSPALLRSSTAESNISGSSSATATTTATTAGGLRELRLGRTASQTSQKSAKGGPASSAPSMMPAPAPFAKRSSSLASPQVLSSTENHGPPDQDAILLELVDAKTKEAVARQELEELKARFEAMRRVVTGTAAGSPVTTPKAEGKNDAATASAGAGMTSGWGWGASSTSTTTTPAPKLDTAAAAVTVRPDAKGGDASSSAPTAPAGGGWGWGGWKRTVSVNNASAAPS